MKKLSLSFNLEDDLFLTSVRLVASSMCDIINRDIDFIEDYKLVITESCLILKNEGFESCSLEFSVSENNINCKIKGIGDGKPSDTEMSELLIEGLMEDYNFEKENDLICGIELNI